MNTIQCKNCDSTISSKFCPECGQKANVGRLSIGSIVHDILHYFTHADKGLIFIIKEMFLRPGTVIEEYISGKRKKYFNPFTFMLLCSTVSAYLYWKLQYYTSIHTQQKTVQDNSEINKLIIQSSTIMEEYGKIITIFMLPLLAIISYLFYYRKKFNYAEHLTIHTFILAQTSIINIFVTVISYYFFPESYFVFNMIFQLVFLLYLTIVFSSVFKEHILISFLKSIGFLILFIISYWIITLSIIYSYNSIIQ